MSKKETSTKKNFSPDWLVQGILTKVGDFFDNLTGRKWKPSSSLATSELIERLKKLLDAEVKDSGEQGKFVPHNLKLKMQWDKFSTDSETALKKLENELLIAAIDHINDNRYQTHAPLKLQVKPDYFTEGVKLQASFDQFSEDEREIEMNVTVPEIKVGDFIPEIQVSIEPEKTIYSAEYAAQGKVKKVELVFVDGKRFSVGRTKGNDLNIDDNSVSKTHAALVLNQESILQVADTGSTNGTFINGQRIAYGKAFPVGDGDTVRFGTVDVLFHRLTNLPENIYNNSETIAEKDVITDVLPNSQAILQNIDDVGIDEDKFQKTEYIQSEEVTAQKVAEPDKYITAKDEVLQAEQHAVFDVEKKP